METESPATTTKHGLGLMPKQFQFVSDREHVELLYSGAFGAGKSRALCVRAVLLAMRHPGARVGLFRKTLAALKATTLVTLLQPDGDLPPVLPPSAYNYRVSDAVIDLNGGGSIVLLGCDNELRVASTPLTDCCIDESIELEESEYRMILGRARVQYTLPDGTKNLNSTASVTNPGSPGHFLYDRFYANPTPRRRRIETNAEENYHLPADYVQTLSEMTGAARDRYFLGLWCAFEGQIYSMFRTEVHERHHPGPFDFHVVGCDWGFQNPCVMRVHAMSFGSRASHVTSELYRSHMTSPQFVQAAIATAQHFRPSIFVVDPSAADLIEQLGAAGLDVYPADNRVEPGIREVQQALTYDEQQKPLLTMEPTCTLGNREYTMYRWKDAVIREQPVKENDHACDADRYARMFIASGLADPVRIYPLDGSAPIRTESERLSDEYAEKHGLKNERRIDPLDERLWPGS